MQLIRSYNVAENHIHRSIYTHNHTFIYIRVSLNSLVEFQQGQSTKAAVSMQDRHVIDYLERR